MRVVSEQALQPDVEDAAEIAQRIKNELDGMNDSWQMMEHLNRIIIRIKAGQISREVLDALNDLVSKHSGDTMIIIDGVNDDVLDDN